MVWVQWWMCTHQHIISVGKAALQVLSDNGKTTTRATLGFAVCMKVSATRTDWSLWQVLGSGQADNSVGIASYCSLGAKVNGSYLEYWENAILQSETSEKAACLLLPNYLGMELTHVLQCISI